MTLPFTSTFRAVVSCSLGWFSEPHGFASLCLAGGSAPYGVSLTTGALSPSNAGDGLDCAFWTHIASQLRRPWWTFRRQAKGLGAGPSPEFHRVAKIGGYDRF